jgi:hypothetical protein
MTCFTRIAPDAHKRNRWIELLWPRSAWTGSIGNASHGPPAGYALS